MNPTHVSELLERAAASVTPTETDPTSRLVSLGRRSVQRRRRAWGTASSVAAAAAVAAVVALPLGTAAQDRSEATGAPGTTVSLGGLSVAVPEGWRTSKVTTFDPCIAEPHTLYLAARWDPGYRRPKSGLPGSTPVKCTSEGQTWMAVVQEGVAQYLTPNRLVVKDGQLLQVEESDRPSMWTYRAFNDGNQATTAFISGDEKDREQLLKRTTWPAGPMAPAHGGLVLPDRIASATSEMPGMVGATDA
ncbi:MAG: hypothetical protein WA890_05215, partial [Micromonospora sp.]